MNRQDTKQEWSKEPSVELEALAHQAIATSLRHGIKRVIHS